MDAPSMSPAPAPAAAMAEQAPAKINFAYHAIIGVAMGIVAPFTAFAWIPAILTGMVIGRGDSERRLGIKASAATRALRVLAVTGGVLAMLFLGAFLFGLLAFVIVALAAFSERVAERTSPTDQGIARILIVIITIAIWVGVFVVLKPNINLSIG